MTQSTVSGLTSTIPPAITTESNESAARLSSIDEFYRTGEVILVDDFEAGLGGRWVMEAGGNVIGLSANFSYSGSNSLQVQSPLAVNGRTVATRSVIVNGNDVFGLQTKVCRLIAASTIDIVEVGLLVGNGNKNYTARWRFNDNLQQLFVLDGNNAWQAIDSIRLPGSVATVVAFSVVKLVVNTETGFYVKLLAGQKEYDLSAVQMPFTLDLSSDFDVVQLELVSMSGDGILVINYFDDVILTRAES